MKITKPDDVILLLGRQGLAEPALTITVAYACGMDGMRLTEQQAWSWLAPLFQQEPFDLAQKKLHGSYAVMGSACAPAGERVGGLTLRVGVGTLEKQLLALGDRHWIRGVTGWHASAPQPFERMPVGLVRAYGGPGWPQNPHGRGYVANSGLADEAPLPNIEHPEHPVLKPSDEPPLATLGPLPQGSPARARWLGPLDAAWRRSRLPFLPDGTDMRWFDRVEQDQCRDGYWRGDESWFAEHMHPHHSVLRGRLPGLRPRLLLRTARAPDERVESPLDLDTVWLFPTDERVVVMYRTVVSTQREDAEDILALAVFTESLSMPALPTDHWASEWCKQEDAAGARPERSRMEADDAGAEAAAVAAMARADIETVAAAQAHRDAVLAEIGHEHRAIAEEVEPYRKIMGRTPLNAAQLEDDALSAAQAALTDEWPDDPAAFAAAVQAHIDNELEQAESEARSFMKAQGRDFDQAMATAKAATTLHGDLDAAQLLASMPISNERKRALLQKYEIFEKQMGTLESDAAELEQRIDAMRAQHAAPPPPRPDEPLPAGRRTPLDRAALLARHAAGQSCGWAMLQDLDLSGLSLRGVDFSRTVMERCVLRGADLEGANFHEAELRQCDLGSARLGSANLQLAMLAECTLEGVSAEGADFSQARMTKVSLGGAILNRTRWDRTRLDECRLGHASLLEAWAPRASYTACSLQAMDARDAQFEWSTFDRCTLTDAVLNEASLPNATLIACQAGGASLAGARMPGLRVLQHTDLGRVCMDRADLEQASLQDSSLVGATLREACLDRGLVKNCDLARTDAWRIKARSTNFTGSHITQASWRGANLMHTRWAEAVLENVDMTGVNLHAADTRRVSAQGVRLKQALLTRCRLIEDYAHG